MDTDSRSGIMLTAEEKNELQSGLRLSWIIWAALFASLGLYVIMAQFVGEDVRQDMELGIQIRTLETALLIVSVVSVLAIRILRRLMLQAGGIGGQSQSGLAEVPLHRKAIQRYNTAMIVALALAESVGIYGLVLYFMGSDMQTMYIFMAFSAVVMYIYRPKYEEIERLAVVIKQAEAGS
jgi:F0F1-type ATP synthase membrane subunit c/vacuolar-type H+-ATPase subunit K